MADRPGRHPPGSDARMKKNCGQIYKEEWTDEVGQVKKCASEINKCDSDERKRSSVFEEKINRNDTAEVGEGDD